MDKNRKWELDRAATNKPKKEVDELMEDVWNYVKLIKGDAYDC